MKYSAKIDSFARRLILWHQKQGRHHLPWQNTLDPYRIWISEIMLQQTQVETVIPYYERFLQKFPNLETLARTDINDVMPYWSGLGYYARARNLHRAAQHIITEHTGRFPRDAATIATLPGIGRSTAAAIAAFAYGEKCAILDGNVKRVLCRVFGIHGFPGHKTVETQLWSLAESLLPEQNINLYTQAQMDLGALICTRSNPTCLHCPVHDLCAARQQGLTDQLPTPRPPRKIPQREVTMTLIRYQNQILLERRPPNGIWGGLLSLPELPKTKAKTPERWIKNTFGLTTGTAKALPPLRHTFTHFVLAIHPLMFDVKQPDFVSDSTIINWLPLSQIQHAALPTPIRRILATLEMLPIEH